MCDFFWQRSMDGGGGELVDIIRSVNGHRSKVVTGGSWQFPMDAGMSFQNFSADDFAFSHTDAFDLRDPLLDELVETTITDCGPDMSYNESRGDDGGSNIQKSTDLFSRVVQILPVKHSTLTHGMSRPFPVVTDRDVHILSPRAPGIKRRKNQVKKVVCIQALTAANSARPSSGEVVPSDLWAWRKYGQKPIKGSPYPRGYYRCSSKGCLARKQVERSRSEPNMLVITYTYEHNHPWPTQRNALAGSTRSSNPKKNHKITPPPPKISNLKEEHINTTTSTSNLTTKVKEELIANDHEIFDKLVLHESSDRCDDFFADWVEWQTSDPYEGVDPFINMFDWEHLS